MMRYFLILLLSMNLIAESSHGMRFDYETIEEYQNRLINELEQTLRWMQQEEIRFKNSQQYFSKIQNSLQTILQDLYKTTIAQEEGLHEIHEKKKKLVAEFRQLLKDQAKSQEIETAVLINKAERKELQALRVKEIKASDAWIMNKGFNDRLVKLHQIAKNPGQLHEDFQKGWLFKRPIKISQQIDSSDIMKENLGIIQFARLEFNQQKTEALALLSRTQDEEKTLTIYREFEEWPKNKFSLYEQKIRINSIFLHSKKELHQSLNQYLSDAKKSINKTYKLGRDQKKAIQIAYNQFEINCKMRLRLYSEGNWHERDLRSIKNEIRKIENDFSKYLFALTKELTDIAAKHRDLDLESKPYLFTNLQYYFSQIDEEISSLRKRQNTVPKPMILGRKLRAYRQHTEHLEQFVKAFKKDVSAGLVKIKIEYKVQNDDKSNEYINSSNISNSLNSYLKERVFEFKEHLQAKEQRLASLFETQDAYDELSKAISFHSSSFYRVVGKLDLQELKVKIDSMYKQIWNSKSDSFNKQYSYVRNTLGGWKTILSIQDSSEKNWEISIKDKLDNYVKKVNELKTNALLNNDPENHLGNIGFLLKEIESAIQIKGFLDLKDSFRHKVIIFASLYEAEQKLELLERKGELAKLNLEKFYTEVTSFSRLLNFYQEYSASFMELKKAEEELLIFTMNEFNKSYHELASGYLQNNDFIFKILGENIFKTFIMAVRQLSTEILESRILNDSNTNILNMDQATEEILLSFKMLSYISDHRYAGVSELKYLNPYYLLVSKIFRIIEIKQINPKHRKEDIHNFVIPHYFSRIYGPHYQHIWSVINPNSTSTSHGLKNFDFTCYFNSIIKLFTLTDLRWYTSSHHKLTINHNGNETKQQFIDRCEFQKLFRQIVEVLIRDDKDNDYIVQIKVESLIRKFGDIKSISFADLNQHHDVADILNQIFEILQISPDQFGIQFEKTIRNGVKYSSSHKDFHLFWPLHKLSSNLQSSINQSLSGITEDNKFMDRSVLTQAPRTLLIHQNRFEKTEDNEELGFKKIRSASEIDPILKIEEFGVEPTKIIYILCGVIIHQGPKVSNGHYVYLNISQQREVTLHDDENTCFIGHLGRLKKIVSHHQEDDELDFNDLLRRDAVMLVYERSHIEKQGKYDRENF